MINIGWMPGYGDEAKEDVVDKSRKAAEIEIATKEKDGELIKEKKDAILSIYDANYKAKKLMVEAETARITAISDTILDFMVEYNILMHQSMNIISIFNKENIKVDQKYYDLQKQINKDTFDFMTHEIPKLITQLQFIDKDSPLYEDYKTGVQNNIKTLFQSQKEQIEHCSKQQKSILQNNEKVLGDCVKNIEVRVTERLLPLFAEGEKQLEYTKKIEALVNNRKMIEVKE